MKPTKITINNYEEEVIKSTMPVLIDFYADWCGPCKMLSPTIEALAEELTDVKVCKVNVDDENQLASAFGVTSIPTIVVMKDGKIYNKAVGLQSREKLISLLN